MAQERKRTARRKRGASKKTKQRQGRPPRFLMRVFALILGVFIVAFIGYFFGYEAGKDEHLLKLNAERQHSFELQSALKKAQGITARHEYEKTPPQPPKRIEKPTSSVSDKPKLAIIIDDVSFAHDVKNIKALGLPLNLSFMPPSKRHPNSAKLAAQEPFYMVHLPMEAVSYAAEEPKTLHVGDSAETIEHRVREIKRLFPRVRYLNNHTGSKFTADRSSMEKLITALDREGITFVDSRTTAKTAVPELMKALHRPYISRDVFLDNAPNVAAIKKQILRAVRIAKKYGTAIAIGHPHKKTLQALAESKDVLNEVELVRIDVLVASLDHE